jgi:diguanylate cyclase (GGDEF)-like protein/PAS domain S-box-containing protein
LSQTGRRSEAERLAAIVAATRAFSSDVPDYGALLRTVARSIAEATGDGCTIRLLSDDGERLVAVGGYHTDPEFRAALEAVVGETTERKDLGIWRRVLESRQAVHVAVNTEDLPADSAAQHVSFAKRWPIRDIILVPLVARGRALGGIALVRYREATPFTTTEQDFLQDLADRAALAVDNARLYRDAHALNAELERAAVARTIELRDVSQAKARIDAIVASSLDPIIGTTPEGIVTAWNPAAERLFGYTAEEMIGHPASRLVPAEQSKERSDLYERLQAGGEQEYSLRSVLRTRKDGTLVPISISAAPIRDSEGVVIGIASVLRDETQRVELERRRAEQLLDARRLNAELEAKVAQRTAELRESNSGLVRLGELGNLLASCGTSDEAHAIIGKSARDLFAGLSGAMYVCASADAPFVIATRWGGLSLVDRIAPQGCLAVQRRRPHVDSPSDRCGHIGSDAQRRSLCVPMFTQSGVQGIFYLTGVASAGDGPVSDRVQQLCVAAAEQSVLALANIRLREELTHSSTRDPLTGLYNRRYADEVLVRELARASRESAQVGILILDLDHFKGINDQFGHEAGDAVLRTFGAVLADAIRSSDVACRLGGEEFLLVLPGASIDATQRKSESIRKRLKEIELSHGGLRLPRVTFSAGVAVFPDNGTAVDILLRSADAAMYEAKDAGRDRTVIASVLASAF